MVFGIADVIKDYSFVFEKFLNNNHNCLLYFLIWSKHSLKYTL